MFVIRITQVDHWAQQTDRLCLMVLLWRLVSNYRMNSVVQCQTLCGLVPIFVLGTVVVDALV